MSVVLSIVYKKYKNSMQFLVCSVWDHHSQEHRNLDGTKAKTEYLIIDIYVHICVEFVAICVYIHVRSARRM